ncbi:MAG: LapA family protein [Candidatus Marinimicrobia bacterium]|nr:LapA family protein [Candidatus Neomarinimicrobiota bacterium]
MKTRQIFIVIISLLLLIILLQNTQVVNFHLLFWKISMSQIILLFLVSIISFIIGYFTHMIINKRRIREPKEK